MHRTKASARTTETRAAVCHSASIGASTVVKFYHFCPSKGADGVRKNRGAQVQGRPRFAATATETQAACPFGVIRPIRPLPTDCPPWNSSLRNLMESYAASVFELRFVQGLWGMEACGVEFSVKSGFHR